MTLAVITGLLLTFIARVAYYRVYAWQRARGRLRSGDPDNPGIFLLTMGTAIGLWFLLDVLFRWQTPMPWRLAAIGTGFILAEGIMAWLARR